MIPSCSTSNSKQQATRDLRNNHAPSTYSYLHNQSSPTRDEESPPPAPPVRDSSTLKSVKYGPGHEKFPSWPVPAAAEAPQALRAPPSGGSHRSKSWTDHTNYPKEKAVSYTRPYMKRQNSSHIRQKLKTVTEKCEKLQPEAYKSYFNKINDRLYMPHVDRNGKALGHMEYNVPSPPERDENKPQLTQVKLEEYTYSYQATAIEKYRQYNHDMKSLENIIEYGKRYEEYNMKQARDETVLTQFHEKQLSYAQSEGYHSYISSTDSTSTPFLDRLRRDSEAQSTRQSASWDDIVKREVTNPRREGRDSVVTTSSGSASSSETLKWHGSMSDVSLASSSQLVNCPSSSVQRQQHIAHSARVQTPQRHHSESVFYISGELQENWNDRENRSDNSDKLKLFAVNTYTVHRDGMKSPQQQVPTQSSQQSSNRIPQPPLSVADRVNELERQRKYSYLDPEKKHKVPDPTLKAIQKKALLSFYERHHSNRKNSDNTSKNNTWRSEPQLGESEAQFVQSEPTLVPTPQPPPRMKTQTPSRRASCASEYAVSNNSNGSSLTSSRENQEFDQMTPIHQYSNSCGSLSTDLLGPVIVGPSISLDDWIPEKPPERPPKNPHLRVAYPDLFQDQRVASPELPPPSPPAVLENEVINTDEPLPPPPPELENTEFQSEFDRLSENTTDYQFAAPQVETSHKIADEICVSTELCMKLPRKPMVDMLEREKARYSSIKCVPNGHKLMVNESRHISSDNRNKVSENGNECSDNGHVLGESKFVSEQNPQLPCRGPSQSDNRHLVNNSKKRLGDIGLPSNRRRFSSDTGDRYKSSTRDHQVFGFYNQTNHAERSSARYPSIPKLILNSNITVSQKIGNGVCDQYLAPPLRTSPSKDDDKLQIVSSIRGNVRTSIAEESPRDVPPPLQPRQMRINQSMRARIPESRSSDITVRSSSPPDFKIPSSRQPNHPMSESKASYLVSRCDRSRIVPDSNTGSYKRTLNSNANLISTEVTPQEMPKLNLKDATWTIKPSKQGILNINNNSIQRWASIYDQNKNPSIRNQEINDDIKKQVILPDVLPINAKFVSRSQYQTPPTNLTLLTHPDEFLPPQTSPKSPKIISRDSSYTPSRSISFSCSPVRTPTMRLFPQTAVSSPDQYTNASITIPSPTRICTSPKISSSLLKVSEIDRPTLLSLQTSSSQSTPSIFTPQEITPLSSRSSPISFLGQQSPPPFPKYVISSETSLSYTSSQPKQLPEPASYSILSYKPTPPKNQSPSSNTPLYTTPESSPPLSPKVISVTHMITPSQSSKELDHPRGIEGLQMIQRTEVILRVNATTSDASSQTDKEELPHTPLSTRTKLQEEIECEKLSEDFIRQLPAGYRLKGLLVPDPEYKTLTDYVTGLFRIDVTMKPRLINSSFRSRNTSSPPLNNPNLITYKTTKSNDLTPEVQAIEATSPLSTTSPYFTTSEPKAKFLTRYNQNMNQYTIKNTKDLNHKKNELVNRLDQKLEVLRSEQLVVSEECRINNELGQNVESHLTVVATLQETSKFRLHIEEIGKITSLLLSLSGRLARVENALIGMAEDHPERRILESKRDKLLEQLDEAKKLKESIDRRSVNVSNILYKYLTSEEYADYDHFINMKAKLIMDSKEIADKIKLGEEQLLALKETLIITD